MHERGAKQRGKDRRTLPARRDVARKGTLYLAVKCPSALIILLTLLPPLPKGGMSLLRQGGFKGG